MTDTTTTADDLEKSPAVVTVGAYVIVRTENAGCFAGTLEGRIGNEATLTDARRLWYWDGAASLSQLATTGTSKPTGCKFPAPVDEILLLGVIEIIGVNDDARKSIESVPVWTS
jgi:hypothetical protein